MPVLIGFLAIALLVALGFFFKVIRLEKPPVPDAQPLPPEEKFPPAPKQAPELINLVEYYAITGEPSEKDAPEGAAELSGEDEEKAQQAEIYEFDRLTGLKVGRGFLLDCQKLLTQAREEKRAYALAYLDFDRFHIINNLKGLSLGDYAITRLAQDIPLIFSPDCLHTRISADHFAVLFPLAGNEDYEVYVERLRQFSDKVRDDIGAKSGLYVTMGVSETLDPQKDYDISVLINKANVARHCLKGAKNADFIVFDQAMLDSDLFEESALEDYGECQYYNDVSLYFQPQASLKTNKITGGQVLVRWSCEDDSARGIPFTIDNGRIPTNNTKVIYQACRAIGRWRKAGKELLPVIIPLSILEFAKTDLDALITRCIQEFQLEASLLVIQMDVDIPKTDRGLAERQLNKLRDIGVKLCIGGLDKGYVNLDGLVDLPMDYVQFHRSVAFRVDSDAERRELVRTMAGAVHHAQAQPIFDGVETLEQLGAIESLEDVWIQGRCAGAACKAEDFLKYLEEISAKSRNQGDTTVILNDAELSRGEYRV